MRKSILLSLLLFVVYTACNGQPSTKPGTLHNPDFNWTITIPDNFTSVSAADWAKLQNRGAQAVESTYGAEVVNQSKTIFVFRNGDFNYLEANYQPFDVNVDGDYLESFKGVNQILLETFKTQMPNAKITSASSTEKISGLAFNVFKVKIGFPNGMTMNTIMYSRLFDKKEFTVNIMYMDEKQGQLMLAAWKDSQFK